MFDEPETTGGRVNLNTLPCRLNETVFQPQGRPYAHARQLLPQNAARFRASEPFARSDSDGVLRPGTKLPPERELAAHFNVARSSLRPALKVLEIMRVITQKVGDGSYLNRDASSVLAVPMEFLFLLDDTSIHG